MKVRSIDMLFVYLDPGAHEILDGSILDGPLDEIQKSVFDTFEVSKSVGVSVGAYAFHIGLSSVTTVTLELSR